MVTQVVSRVAKYETSTNLLTFTTLKDVPGGIPKSDL